MNKLIKRLLSKWVLKNYPFEVVTQTRLIYRVFIKKGKIRKWVSYDQYGNVFVVPKKE